MFEEWRILFYPVVVRAGLEHVLRAVSRQHLLSCRQRQVELVEVRDACR
jgi:hypothetical protein